jgi:hypothetical protein
MQANADKYKFRGYAGIIRNTLMELNENAVYKSRLSFFGVIKKWLAGHVKLNGILKLIVLWDLFCILQKAKAN